MVGKAGQEYLLALEENAKTKLLNPDDVKGVEEVTKMATWLIDEYILHNDDLIIEWYKSFGFDSPNKEVTDHQFKRTPYSLLSKHPVLCGLMVFRLQMLLQDIGVGLDFYSGTFVATAYLYNEARNQGLCEEWKDLETMIEFYGKDKLFVGARPQTAHDSYKRIKLYFGMSITEFTPFKSKQKRPAAKNSRIDAPDRMRSTGRRKLSNPSVIWKMFMSRYCTEYFDRFPVENKGGFDLHSIETLVSDIRLPHPHFPNKAGALETFRDRSGSTLTDQSSMLTFRRLRHPQMA